MAQKAKKATKAYLKNMSLAQKSPNCLLLNSLQNLYQIFKLKITDKKRDNAPWIL